MIGQSAVVTLRAYGYDARSDGLGNVQARVWHRHADATQTWLWANVPTDGPGLLRWLGEATSENAGRARSRAASLTTEDRLDAAAPARPTRRRPDPPATRHGRPAVAHYPATGRPGHPRRRDRRTRAHSAPPDRDLFRCRGPA